MTNWKETTIGDCLAGIIDNRGKTPPQCESPTSYELLEVNAVVNVVKSPNYKVVKKYVSEETYKNWFRSGHPEPGDILFATVGSIAEVALMTEQRGSIAQNLIALRVNRKIVDPCYLYYVLKDPHTKTRLKSLDISSVQPSIKVPHLLNFPVMLPSLTEQKRIASILGSLDDKIELNRKQNETLEAMARALFQSWFVDFDPVMDNAIEAKKPIPAELADKAARRKAAKGKFPALPKEIRKLFPSEFEPSPLGPIPKGWKVCPMPDYIDVNPQRVLRKGQIAPYLEMKALPTQGHRPEGWFDREFTSGTKFTNGDTLLARITPCLENGKTAFVDFLGRNQTAWGSTEYIVLKSKSPLPDTFTYFLARDDNFRAFAIGQMTGSSGRQRVPNDCFNKYQLTIPRGEVCTVWGSQVEELMNKIKTNSEESSTLAQLRDTLLPKLLSGEIEI